MPEHEGERIHNRTLELDGNTFRRCHLINCQVRFRGMAPFVFEANRYEGSFTIDLLDAWKTMVDAIDPLRRELARYGANLDDALFPDPGVWASPGAYAAYVEGPERHIAYWFERPGKPGGGLRLLESKEGS